MNDAIGASRLLSAENLTFIQQGISITAASRDVRLVPSLSRVLSCRVDADGQRLRLALVRSQGLILLRDIAATGAIAAVFSQPSTHRSLQIKGLDACEVAVDAADQDSVRDSQQAFAAEIALLGFDAAFSTRFYHVAPDDLAVVTFTPAQVFQQTPGPNAGAPLGVSA